MDDFDLDAFLDETLFEIENEQREKNSTSGTTRPAAEVSNADARIRLEGCTGHPTVGYLEGIYVLSDKINGQDSFRKQETSVDIAEHIIIWFNEILQGWVISLESDVNGDLSNMIARCLQNKEKVWELNKVWEIWDKDIHKKFVNISSMRIVAYSDCPFDQSAMVDIFANAGLVLDKDEAVDDVLNMFANNEAKIREQEGQFGGGMEDFMKMLGGFDGGGDEGGDDGIFEDAMMKMLQQVLKKDVLYEPILNINSKFPQWIEENRERLSPEEIDLYTQQKEKVQEIEDTLNSSDDPDMALVMRLFNEMMAICNFPQELLAGVFGDMGVDMNDMDSLASGASNFLNMSEDDSTTFGALANQFLNSEGNNEAVDPDNDLAEFSELFEQMGDWFK